MERAAPPTTTARATRPFAGQLSHDLMHRRIVVVEGAAVQIDLNKGLTPCPNPTRHLRSGVEPGRGRCCCRCLRVLPPQPGERVAEQNGLAAAPEPDHNHGVVFATLDGSLQEAMQFALRVL